MLSLEVGDRMDNIVDSFPRHEASELQDREVIGPAQKLASIGLVHRRHLGRIESARNHVDPLGFGVVERDQIDAILSTFGNDGVGSFDRLSFEIETAVRESISVALMRAAYQAQ